MGLFEKPILTGKRKKALEGFRKNAISALKDLSKKAKDDVSKAIFDRMVYSVEKTPIYFFPRKVLKATFLPGTNIPVAATMGENVSKFKIFHEGERDFFVRDNYINLPAGHVFSGDNLSMNGIFTLAHEYAHFPKPAIAEFARLHHLSHERAEELVADILSAKLCVKMGFPKEHVLGHFIGREIVYGNFPFWKFIENAVK